MANTAPVLNSTLTRVNHIYENTYTGSVPFNYFNFGLDSFGASINGATDADLPVGSIFGIAITGVTGVTGGTVEYSVDGGTHWLVAATAPAGSAVVFAADTLLRYTPPADANGTRLMTFRAWDGTGGYVSGQVVNLTTAGTGGSSPFSADTATHSLVIDANDGHVITNVGLDDEMAASAIDSNGKLIVVGGDLANGQIEILRYNTNGSLDTTFSADGKTSIALLGVTPGDLFNSANFTITSAGKYLVSAESSHLDSVTLEWTSSLFLAQFNTDGTLDTTFGGGDGVVIQELPLVPDYSMIWSGYSIALQTDGKILTAAQLQNNGLMEYGILRHTASGVLDTTWGGDGLVTFSVPGMMTGYIDSVLFQTGGAVYAVGNQFVDFNDTAGTTTVVRFTSTGAVDTTYGTAGVASFEMGVGNDYDIATAIFQTDGKLLIACSSTGFDSVTTIPGDFVIARLTTAGVLDTTFSGDGKLTTDFGADDVDPIIKIDVNGKILVAGTTFDYVKQIGDFVVARYNTDGSLDTTFGTGGKFTTKFPEMATVTDLEIQADGKIILAGAVSDGGLFAGGPSDFALVRLNSNGTLDNTYVGQNNAPELDPTLFREGNVFQGETTIHVPISYFNTGYGLSGFSQGARDADGRFGDQLGVAITLEGGTSITGDVSAGIVEYSVDGGLTWVTDNNTHAPGSGLATVFAGNALMRYTPDANASGTRTITFHTWDGTGGYTTGQVVNLNTIGTGGSSPFSATTATHDLVIVGYTDGLAGDDILDAPAPPSAGQPGSFAGTYLRGLGGNDSMMGSLNNDKLEGGEGNDELDGAGGSDRLYGGNGDDLLRDLDFGENDVLDGGAGNDTVTFAGAAGPIFASLLTNNAGPSTTFVSIENLIGSGFNDTLYGNAQNNVLAGGAGADTLDGGDGIDTADYSALATAVTAELWRGNATNDGSGSIDTFIAIENLTGGLGNDILTGNAANNILNGGAGNDTVNGGAGNDTVNGGAGTDTVLGGTGDDALIGGTGADTLDGGDGIDTADYSALATAVTAELWRGNATNDGSGSIDTFIAIENLTGGSGNDILTGNAANNILNGGAGNDTVNGGAGNDTVNGGAGTDTVLGGTGDDALIGGTGADTLDGGDGIDTADYSALATAVTAELWRGNATNDGSGSIDTFIAIENLTGGSGNDILTGNAANNILNGGAGNDTVNGGAGNDTVNGGAGTDSVLGGTGDDKLFGGSGADTLDGGDGIDTADYSILGTAVTAELWRGNAANDGTGSIDTFIAIENLTGGSANDILTGNAVNNIINGGAGNDTVNGGAGNDTVIGGLGKDTITGGTGTDIFDFNALLESVVGVNRDIITDFSSAQLDKIDLSTIDANSTLVNDQAFLSTILTSGNFNAIGQLRLVGNILSGNTDANLTTSEFEIQLTGVTSLTGTDFIL